MISFIYYDSRTLQSSCGLYQITFTTDDDGHVLYALYERTDLQDCFSKDGYYSSLTDLFEYLNSIWDFA